MTAVGAPMGVRAGLRPFNPFRDLVGVTALLSSVFGPELSLESRSAAQLVRWMQAYPSVGWIWMGFDAWFDGTMRGFIWQEGGRVVGNANIAPIGPNGRQWVLSNVAVAEGLRGRGIGRRMVEACLDYAWSSGADRVLLQVWEENAPALHLYQSLRFASVSRVYRLTADPECLSDTGSDAVGPGLAWSPLRGQDLGAIGELASRMLPSTARLVRPSLLHPFRPGMLERLQRLVSGPASGLRASRSVLRRGPSVAAALALLPITESLARLTVVAPADPDDDVVRAVMWRLGDLVGARQVGLIADLPASLERLRDRMTDRGWVHRDSLLQMVAERPYASSRDWTD